MPTTKPVSPDLSDLWRKIAQPGAQPAGTDIRALSYVQHASGPVITLITSEPINLDQLLRDVSGRSSTT